MLAPAINENARLPFRSELPSTKRSRGTTETNSDASATLKTTVSAPTHECDDDELDEGEEVDRVRQGHREQQERRPMSAAIIASRRRPRRSTQAPA